MIDKIVLNLVKFFFGDFSMKTLINKAILKLNMDGTKQILEVITKFCRLFRRISYSNILGKMAEK